MKLNLDEIRLMAAFEKITRVSPKDCVFSTPNSILFVVDHRFMRNVIGKKGETIKKVKDSFKKNIEVIAYDKSPEKFLQKAFPGIKLESEVKNNVAVISLDSENKRKMMGNISRLKKVKVVAKRNFGIEDIRIK